MKTYRLKEVALLLAMLLIPGVVSAKEIVQGEVWLDTAGNPSGCVAIGDCPDRSRFEAGAGAFLLNGEPFVVKAAELHYPRIPREYWEQRILLCKALGMNTICLYAFWNAHEPRMDRFDFTGQNDIREFIRLCGKNDMKVILRPGPYVCAEWEMGGLPWWLLKKKDILLR